MTSPERRRFEGRAHRALLRKEVAEGRSAIIGGLVMFLGLPVLWSGLYSIFDLRHEVFPGLASGLLLLAGWLYGAVVGAQIICRDFGRAQGAFLSARPVTPAEIVRAKITVGFGLILMLALAVGLCEVVITLLAAPNYIDKGVLGLWLLAAVATVVAFWIAMAAAAITRQTLSGVMVAGLALILSVTVPIAGR